MKRLIIFITAIIFTTQLFAKGVEIIKPLSKQANTFAIIIDNVTYDKAGEQVRAYRDALEADGLATYIVSAAWENPEQIRSQIKKLYSKAKNLEGIVLVGDIPYVMVRNAQHMTTAFKMDEDEYDKGQSSVTSDRFYDDLHLEFEFLAKDTLNPLKFWYKLSENCTQTINPNFYSGRIMYPSKLGGDKYEAIAKYLEKAVEAKKNPEMLDNLLTYAGGSYNSDCLIVWQDEKIAVNENFPFLGKSYKSLKQLNFRMEQDMKYQLFDQLQRPELDVILFNEHGSVDKQHISGDGIIEGVEDRLMLFRSDLNFQLRYNTPKEKRDEARAQMLKEYGLDEKFFDAKPEERKKKTEGELINDPDPSAITLDDLKGFKTQPRFVMFNACYNGSFHKEGYIAGYYIFNDGKTVVTQGNTVNVLQDRWTYEMLGLISHGVRIGEYNRMIATLEGHIIGDPTFHFKEQDGCKLRSEIVTRAKDVEYWENLTESEYADIQSLALRKLADMNAISSFEILTHMKRSHFGTTRMECLKLLSRFRNADFIEAIKTGLYDSYELTRRNAAEFASRAGDESLLESIVDVYVKYPESQRVCFLLQKALRFYPEAAIKDALAKVAPTMTDINVNEVLANVEKTVEMQQKSKDKTIEKLFDKEASVKQRISAARTMRNDTYHGYIPQMLELVADKSQDVKVRVNVAEMMGWYDKSVLCNQMIEGINSILQDKTLEPELRKELVQTVNRLK